ncbi:MAG: hypothetical protein H7A33_01940 [Deltaproteobacteria bacterium]|nr:hypothetical protein [Deltaproteobacteria bacterium]
MKLCEDIQEHIESLYGIKVGESACDYLIDRESVLTLIASNQADVTLPKELFLVNNAPEDETLEVALFLDHDLQQNLTTHNPLENLSRKNISDFCTLIEGISHFVYYLHKAALEHNITQLEMELQAEIDKFLLLSLLTRCEHLPTGQLLALLFENYQLHKHLGDEQIERYQQASQLAARFCHKISRDIQEKRMPELLQKIREFYPLSQQEKIDSILN